MPEYCTGFEAFHQNGRLARNVLCLVNHASVHEANLIQQWVVFSGVPLLCFFTRRAVAEGEQFCYSYFGEDADEWFESRGAQNLPLLPKRVYKCNHFKSKH